MDILTPETSIETRQRLRYTLASRIRHLRGYTAAFKRSGNRPNKVEEEAYIQRMSYVLSVARELGSEQYEKTSRIMLWEDARSWEPLMKTCGSVFGPFSQIPSYGLKVPCSPIGPILETPTV